MNIIRIAFKEIQQSLRNKVTMALMILFPLVLILILGMAFSGMMNGSIRLGEVEVIYKIEEDGFLSNTFRMFIDDMEEYDVTFIEVFSHEQALQNIKDSQYSCYIRVDDSGQTITFYKNDYYNFQASFIESVVQTFVQRFNGLSGIAVENPDALPEIMEESERQYVNVTSIDGHRKPRAMDYYGITVITMAIMYAAMASAMSIRDQKVNMTLRRMLTTPVKRIHVLIGISLGVVVITAIQILILTLFSRYAISVYYGERIDLVLFVFLSEIVMAVAIGVGLAFVIENKGAIAAVLNFVIPILTFLGGGFIPLDQFENKTFQAVSKLSPVRWTNQAIINLIYNGDLETVMFAVSFNLVIAAVFLVLSSNLFIHKEVISS